MFPNWLVATNVTAVAAGVDYSLFKVGGSLWGMGRNDFGQLGDGTYMNHYFPEQIVSSQVTAFAAGNGYSLFGEFRSPSGPGSLWGTGLNYCGRAGFERLYADQYAPANPLRAAFPGGLRRCCRWKQLHYVHQTRRQPLGHG